ncbi:MULTISPECIES: cobalt ECF transporter T component CbiQ [Robertmurraya]|uniref:cobalt ECF transporter T component CbiQ n=1 Tax=Robertmurraya TaxID=2837507 RepID=UPI0010F83A5E|nr:cobalt ECF transporter T component CbiQ [Robertmurraya siralis]
MLPIDQMAYCNAFRNVHPLEKGIFAASLLFFSLLLKNAASAIFIFVFMSIVIVKGAKIPLLYYIKLLLLPSFFLCTSVLFILFSVAPVSTEILNILFQIEIANWRIYISVDNAEQVLELFLSVMAGVSCMYFLILTTPMQQIIWLLQKMRLPSLFIELFVVTYRFIFVLLENMNEIRIAQTSRLGYFRIKQSFYSLAQLIISIFVKSLKTAQDVQKASDSRGNNSGQFLQVEIQQSFNKRNWLTIGCTVFLTYFIFFLGKNV